MPGAGADRRLEGPIEQAWFTPAATLHGRITATRRAALEVGVWNYDAGALGVLRGGGVDAAPVERARAAVRLAPDLPLARMELAEAIWLHEEAPMSALRAVGDAMLAATRHTQASLWFAGSGLTVLAMALVLGGLLSIGLAAAFAAPHAAHDLGDLVSRAMPPFARAAFLGSLLLVPLWLGEGWLGLALVGMGLGMIYGKPAGRVALVLAACVVLAGLYPGARMAGTVLTAFASDPVAESAYAVAGGSPLRTHRDRLAPAASDDPLAEEAMARWARRAGNLGVADARYQALLAAAPDDYVVANNAANVRLALGHLETALDLYREAIEYRESPVILYNLAQAYGRAFQVEDLAVTLQRAQQLDSPLLAELTELQGTDPEGFVVDLPLTVDLMWRRLQASSGGETVAAELRAPLAPGRLGRDPLLAVVVFALVAAFSCGLGTRFHRSGWCPRCGRRLCTRCEEEPVRGAMCGACTRLFYQPETTDRLLRQERVAALRAREKKLERVSWLASLAIPGAAGLLADQPLRSLVASLAFALAVMAVVWRTGVTPDPLVAGTAGPVFFGCIAAISGLVYGALLALTLATRRRA